MVGGRLLAAGSSPPGTCIQKAVASCPMLRPGRHPFPFASVRVERDRFFKGKGELPAWRACWRGPGGRGRGEGKNGPTPTQPTNPPCFGQSYQSLFSLSLSSSNLVSFSPRPPLLLPGVFSTVPRLVPFLPPRPTLLLTLSLSISLSLYPSL